MTPKRAFQQHRANSQARGIAFEMTFDEWWAIWKDYFHLRGRGKNGLCMARNGDAGPYAVGNVYLTTNLGNAADVDRRKRLMPDEKRIAQEQKRDKHVRQYTDYDLKSHIAYKSSCDSEEVMAE